ncbi:MAG TPA: VOC family protein [Candidatus Elarobacter sp.]|nr:VOC family protein [Candidatus Elarobacter sp.]
MIKAIAFTGSAVTDMPRARAFYEGVLGLGPALEMAGGKWVEYDVGGGTFALTNIAADSWKPSEQGTAVAFEVDDLDAMVAKVKASGAKFYMEKMESPICWMAIAHDPDGNKVVLHTLKPKQ